MKIDNQISSVLLKTKLELYKRRKDKDLIDIWSATSIVVFLALIEANGSKLFIFSLGIGYFFYFSSGILVFVRLNWIRKNAKRKILTSTAFLYNIIDDMQLTLWFMCAWIASMNIFEQNTQTAKALSLSMVSACFLVLLSAAKIIKSKPQRLKNGDQNKFTKITTFVPSIFGMILLLYFVFVNNLPINNLDFIIALIGTFLAWLLAPTLIWEIYEIIFLTLAKSPANDKQ